MLTVRSLFSGIGSGRMWKRISLSANDCPLCDSAIEVLTDAPCGFAWHGDAVRCVGRCGLIGRISFGAEDGEASVYWNEYDFERIGPHGE